MRKAQDLIDRINNMGLTIDREQMHSAIMQRVNEVDGQIATILLSLVEFDNPNETVHETGRSYSDTLDLLEGRRNRLLRYIEEAGLLDESSIPTGV